MVVLAILVVVLVILVVVLVVVVADIGLRIGKRKDVMLLEVYGRERWCCCVYVVGL